MLLVPASAARRSRRGMSLLEVMVVVAIMLALFAVLAPATRSLLALDQRGAARKLAVQYERLNDEAAMRNRTFRVIYLFEENKYIIEAGEAGGLIAASPEDRESYEREVESKQRFMSEEEKAEWLRTQKQPFESMGSNGRLEVRLPDSLRIGGVYTPQYGKMVRPGDRLDGQDPDEPLKVATYVMNSGFSEPALIWLVSARNPDNGWTVQVEPLSGVVHLHGELLHPRDIEDQLPTEGPSLPN